jgi:hypothetical protein
LEIAEYRFVDRGSDLKRMLASFILGRATKPQADMFFMARKADRPMFVALNELSGQLENIRLKERPLIAKPSTNMIQAQQLFEFRRGYLSGDTAIPLAPSACHGITLANMESSER